MKQARILTFTLVLFSLLLFIGLMPVHGEEEIYESVVRLHVLAHSDSEEDQALKLAVRDAVLAYTSPLLAECKDREEAEARLRESLDDIRAVAEECLREKGDPHRVEAVLVREEYPTKSYDGICFPSGDQDGEKCEALFQEIFLIPVPSAFITKISQLLLRSVTNAILVPSGDQRG